MRSACFIIVILVSGAALCADAVDEARIKELLTQLSSDDFETREAATAGLIECGEGAWRLVAPEMKSEGTDKQARLEEVARQISTFLTAAEIEKAAKFKTLLESQDE